MYLQLGVYKDDIVNGFKAKDYVMKVAQVFAPLKDLFQGTLEAIQMEDE